MAKGDEPEIPARSLVVREPWASLIIGGRKTWEIRRYPTRVRGRIGIVSRRGLIGTVRLVDVLGPFTVEELMVHLEKHLAPEEVLREYAGGGELYAWVLAEPEEFPEPFQVERPRGPRTWVPGSQVRRTTPP